MRTLILQMTFHGDVDQHGTMEATFDEKDGTLVSTDEALKGLAFGAALLYKHKLAEMDRQKFIGLMGAYINGSIDACNPVPDKDGFN